MHNNPTASMHQIIVIVIPFYFMTVYPASKVVSCWIRTMKGTVIVKV